MPSTAVHRGSSHRSWRRSRSRPRHVESPRHRSPKSSSRTTMYKPSSSIYARRRLVDSALERKHKVPLRNDSRDRNLPTISEDSNSWRILACKLQQNFANLLGVVRHEFRRVGVDGSKYGREHMFVNLGVMQTQSNLLAMLHSQDVKVYSSHEEASVLATRVKCRRPTNHSDSPQRDGDTESTTTVTTPTPATSTGSTLNSPSMAAATCRTTLLRRPFQDVFTWRNPQSEALLHLSHESMLQYLDSHRDHFEAFRESVVQWLASSSTTNTTSSSTLSSSSQKVVVERSKSPLPSLSTATQNGDKIKLSSSTTANTTTTLASASHRGSQEGESSRRCERKRQHEAVSRSRSMSSEGVAKRHRSSLAKKSNGFTLLPPVEVKDLEQPITSPAACSFHSHTFTDSYSPIVFSSLHSPADCDNPGEHNSKTESPSPEDAIPPENVLHELAEGDESEHDDYRSDVESALPVVPVDENDVDDQLDFEELGESWESARFLASPSPRPVSEAGGKLDEGAVEEKPYVNGIDSQASGHEEGEISDEDQESSAPVVREEEVVHKSSPNKAKKKKSKKSKKHQKQESVSPEAAAVVVASTVKVAHQANKKPATDRRRPKSVESESSRRRHQSSSQRHSTRQRRSHSSSSRSVSLSPVNKNRSRDRDRQRQRQRRSSSRSERRRRLRDISSSPRLAEKSSSRRSTTKYRR